MGNETPAEREARWRAEAKADDEADKASPDFVFEMDGSNHFRHGATGCCRQFGRTCAACGGFQHYQPVYGGYYYKCEACGVENG